MFYVASTLVRTLPLFLDGRERTYQAVSAWRRALWILCSPLSLLRCGLDVAVASVCVRGVPACPLMFLLCGTGWLTTPFLLSSCHGDPRRSVTISTGTCHGA